MDGEDKLWQAVQLTLI